MKNEELWDPTLHPVSLRLGHAAGLTVPRTVIQYRGAAALPVNRGGEPRFCSNSVFGQRFCRYPSNFVSANRDLPPALPP